VFSSRYGLNVVTSPWKSFCLKRFNIRPPLVSTIVWPAASTDVKRNYGKLNCNMDWKVLGSIFLGYLEIEKFWGNGVDSRTVRTSKIKESWVVTYFVYWIKLPSWGVKWPKRETEHSASVRCLCAMMAIRHGHGRTKETMTQYEMSPYLAVWGTFGCESLPPGLLSCPSPAMQLGNQRARQRPTVGPGYLPCMMHGIRDLCVMVMYVWDPVLAGLLWKPITTSKCSECALCERISTGFVNRCP
jgi:hypothetical protein